MEQVKIYKFLDRPVPFTLIQDANKIKLSDVYRNHLKLMPCSWLGEELAKLIKGVNNE